MRATTSLSKSILVFPEEFGVDVVLDAKMPLRDVHDLAEALQYSVESLHGVERAFVHSDYTVGNPSGHIRGR
jgi:divalent metal cation (Fe/Co/Zn/Cd) transporter